MAAAVLARGRRPRPGVRLLGAGLAAAGLGVAAAAARALGGALTMFPRPREEAALVTHGPYALARHPLYTAGILVVGGQALYRGSRRGLLLTAALALLWDFKARREEDLLAQRFRAYAAYRTRTPRRFLPLVY